MRSKVQAQSTEIADSKARRGRKGRSAGSKKAKPSIRATPGPKTVAEGAVESIQDAITQLNRCTARVKAMLDGEEYDNQLASHLSWLTKNMAACLDAMRKQESAERARWKTMGRAEEVQLVKVWLDELPVGERAEIAEHLAGLGEGGGLLS